MWHTASPRRSSRNTWAGRAKQHRAAGLLPLPTGRSGRADRRTSACRPSARAQRPPKLPCRPRGLAAQREPHHPPHPRRPPGPAPPSRRPSAPAPPSASGTTHPRPAAPGRQPAAPAPPSPTRSTQPPAHPARTTQRHRHHPAASPPHGHQLSLATEPVSLPRFAVTSCACHVPAITRSLNVWWRPHATKLTNKLQGGAAVPANRNNLRKGAGRDCRGRPGSGRLGEIAAADPAVGGSGEIAAAD
jgi:hypothetical protein